MAGKTYDFRCPVHGFITVDEWEREIIDHWVFQRLRHIRQLGWTDMVYPGAMHTRFEHSLGVAHLAGRMFEEVWLRQKRILEQLYFTEEMKSRERRVLRFAALLHDIGHAPFSHVGEELMPLGADKKRIKHEAYSGEIIRRFLTDVIDENPRNRSFDITAAQVADVIEGKTTIGHNLLFWKQLMSSQLDADRSDYLLRDSLHIGVQYGHYDLNRLVISLAVSRTDTGAAVLAVNEGGWHAAEALIIARYMMFSQVYFHKTRTIYDYHVTQALKSILEDAQKSEGLADTGAFPPPTDETNLRKYLEWDDWRVLGILSQGGGGQHGRILRDRRHYRAVYQTPENATPADLKAAEDVTKRLADEFGEDQLFVDDANRSWYKVSGEILVARGDEDSIDKELVPLSQHSKVVEALKPTNMRRIYVPPELKERAKAIVSSITRGKGANNED